MTQDLEHLKLLSIFHYVVAGMAALLACMPFIHFFLGLAMASGAFGEQDPAAEVVGGVFMIIAGAFIFMGWTVALLIFLAGRRLAARRSYTFCLVMGAVECMFMPFGTVLGVFTIIVLMRESVKGLFVAGGGGPGAGSSPVSAAESTAAELSQGTLPGGP